MEKIFVGADDTVLRRIPNRPSHIKSNGTLSSANFIGPDTSVNIERLTTIEETLAGHAKFGLVRLLTAQSENSGQMLCMSRLKVIMHTPLYPEKGRLVLHEN